MSSPLTYSLSHTLSSNLDRWLSWKPVNRLRMAQYQSQPMLNMQGSAGCTGATNLFIWWLPHHLLLHHFFPLYASGTPFVMYHLFAIHLKKLTNLIICKKFVSHRTYTHSSTSLSSWTHYLRSSYIKNV